MLRRKAYQKLLDWKNDRNHKALCIFGARQIGKTTLIRKFGKESCKQKSIAEMKKVPQNLRS